MIVKVNDKVSIETAGILSITPTESGDTVIRYHLGHTVTIKNTDASRAEISKRLRLIT